MSRTTPTTCKIRKWPAYNEALKRRGSLRIRFDPMMNGNAAPTGRRGCQRTNSDAAIQTCLSMKVLHRYSTSARVPARWQSIWTGWTPMPLTSPPRCSSVARGKGLYRNYIQGDLTQPLALADDSYGAVISCGTLPMTRAL